MRSTFWPTVLSGTAAAALTAVAAGQDWAKATDAVAGVPSEVATKGSDIAPLALALALVSLAGWGAVLVLRSRGRRVVAVLGAVSAVGVLVAALRATDEGETAWFYLTFVGAAATALAFAAALAKAGTWPEMSAKYDAPGDRPAEQADLWKALDEGHDPTA